MVAELLKKSGLTLAVAAVLSLPATADAQYWRGGYGRGGGIGPGAAVGLGLGSFALGAAVGSAASRPYGYGYNPYGYYAPPPAYYPPPPAYSYRTCWYPQYNGYYAC
jgi:hypothetical protein